VNGITQTDKTCIDCRGVGMVADFKPTPFLTNNPQPVCTSPPLCCNEPRKALLRVRPASTNLKKNYFTTLEQYRQNRCLTYDQRIFNFQTPLDVAVQEAIYRNNPYLTPKSIALAKPGSPLTTLNTYVANCYPNTSNVMSQEQLILVSFNLIKNAGLLTQEDIDTFYSSTMTTTSDFVQFISNLGSSSGEAERIFNNFITNPYANNSYLAGPSNPLNCKLVVYKPNNPQFAVQGSVESSTRTLKLGLTTIEKNIYNQNKLKGYGTNKNNGHHTFAPFIYKSKTPECSPAIPLIFSKITTNPKSCFKQGNDSMDNTIHNLSAINYNVATNGISASIPGGQPLI
jgi:hypothetical protein